MASYSQGVGGAFIQAIACSQGVGGEYRCRLVASQGVGGAYFAGDTIEPPVSDFIPTGLEAIAHEVFNEVGLDPEIFGELVTFTDGTGTEYPVYAILQFDDPQVRMDPDGRRRVRLGRVFVSYDPIVGISTPDWRWTMRARGETFAIEDVGERQGGCWEMRFVRTESQEKTQSRRRSI